MREKVEVLLVEDNQDHIFLTKSALDRFDPAILNLHVVTDGAAAIQFFRKEPPHEKAPTPDLVLLDIKLPNMSGFEVLSWLKGQKRFQAIPIVMLTSSDSERDIARSYKLGSNSYVTKPMNSSDLSKKIWQIPQYWLKVNTLPPRA